MKILQILEESPSLDFTLPIFEFTDDNCEILVFSTKPSYQHWYDENPKNLMFNNTNVKFLTCIDSLNIGNGLKQYLHSNTKNNRSNDKNILSKISRKFFNLVINTLCKPDEFIKDYFKGDPDIIFIETRNDLIPNKINKKLFQWINENNIKTVGVPNSAYTLENVKWSPIEPFGVHKITSPPFNSFPKNFEYWMTSEQPFVIEQLGNIPYKIVGYPGVDTKWLELFEYKSNGKKSMDEINILINIRHFGQKRNLGYGTGQYVVEDIEEFFSTIKDLINSIKNVSFNLFIKPHYYVNFSEFEKILKNLDINHYKFVKTSIYKALLNMDIVIGLHTSVNLVSALAGYPTLLYPQVLSNNLKKDDVKTNLMYEGMMGYSEDIEEFKLIFKKLLMADMRSSFSKKDSKFLRKFFKDNSIENLSPYINLNLN